METVKYDYLHKWLKLYNAKTFFNILYPIQCCSNISVEFCTSLVPSSSTITCVILIVESQYQYYFSHSTVQYCTLILFSISTVLTVLHTQY